MLTSLRIVFTIIILSLLGCKWEAKQERISACMTACNGTDCRPDSGLTARDSEACHQCVLHCSEVP
jgi:hypothetical protein